ALVRIRYEQIGVNNHLRPKPVTFRTGAERTVKGEHPRRQLLNAETADRAGKIRAEPQLLLADDVDEQLSPRHFQSRLDRIRQPASHVLLNDDPVHDHLDRMLLIFLQLNIFGQVTLLTVDSHPYEALLG